MSPLKVGAGRTAPPRHLVEVDDPLPLVPRRRREPVDAVWDPAVEGARPGA